jgi:GLPGLI family protein
MGYIFTGQLPRSMHACRVRRFFTLGCFIFSSFLYAGPCFAQRKIAEMTLSYDAKISRLKDEQPMEVAVTNIYLKGPYSRTDMISSLLKTSTIFHEKDSAGALLREVSGQKILILMTKDQWKESNSKYEGIHFEYTPETKVIAGYTCKKAIGTLPDNTVFSVYYTPDLLPENKIYDYLFRDLKGLPMEWEQVQGSVKILFTLSKISMNPVPRSVFDIPKTGYRQLSYEESKKLSEH